MKKTIRKQVLICCVSLLLGSIVFAQSDDSGNKTGEICILSYKSNFKNELAGDLKEYFGSMGIHVTVDSISNYKEHDADDYDAVILLSAVMAGRPRAKGVNYIKENDYSPNIIYVFTTGGNNDPYGRGLDKSRIDAITTASRADGQKYSDMKEQIIKRTLEIIRA